VIESDAGVATQLLETVSGHLVALASKVREAGLPAMGFSGDVETVAEVSSSDTGFAPNQPNEPQEDAPR
jgi:hypothetical protein